MQPILKKYHIYILLTIFFIVALFIRLYSLGNIPGGFHEDEAHIGYNAYSLLKTLHDKNNVYLPLSIDQFGDFRPSGLHFLTIPSVAFFGLNEFATRFPVAVVGSLCIIVFYLVALEIFRNKKIALIAAGLMAVNPWEFIASRSTSESIVALFFVMLGIYALLVVVRINKSVKTNRPKALGFAILAFLSFLLSFQFYHAARYFVPIIVAFILLIVTFDKSITKKTKTLLLIGAVCLFILLGLLLKLGSGSGRVEEISIFTNPATAIEFWKQKSEDKGLSPILVQFFHNKLTAYGYTALTNYGEHFTPDFLFFKGGLPPRYQVPWNGNYYPVDALFIIIGFSVMLTKLLERKGGTFLLALPFIWLAVGPLPAAFTFEDIPHFQRAIMMMPALLLFAAYGLYYIFTYKVSKKILILLYLIIGGIMLYQVILFAHDYFHHTLTHNANSRNEGEKDLISTVSQYQKDGRNIIMTTQNGNRLIFYLFFNKIDPATFQKLGSPRDANNLQYDGVTYRTDVDEWSLDFGRKF